MIFKRRKKYTAWRPKYREPLARRGILRSRRASLSPKIYGRTQRETKFQTSSKTQKKFYLILALLIAGGLVYLCFFSNLFKIKKIVLVDNKDVHLSRVEEIVRPILNEKRLLVFPGDSIFLMNTKSIKNELTGNILEIESLQIKRRYPDVLKIVIQEKEPVIIWVTQDKVYFVGRKGEICYEISREILQDTDLAIVQDNLGKEVKPNDKVIKEDVVSAIENINKRFQAKTGYEILHFEIPAAMASEVHVKTKRGFKVYFNCQRSTDVQLDDLVAVLEHQVKGQIGSVNYIDLRIEGWIYYR